MMFRVNIACETIRHNRPRLTAASWGPAGALTVAAFTAILPIALLGCAASPPVSCEVPAWELAYATPAKHLLLARTRVSYDRPLPAHLTQPLCDQYSLVTITRPADWHEVRRRLQLSPAAGVDLSQGIIVGIVANVGEPAHGHWPIHLRAVRTRAGEGWIEAAFASGLYYPLQAAGYLELAYVPGLQSVRTVRINTKTFMIRSATPAH